MLFTLHGHGFGHPFTYPPYRHTHTHTCHANKRQSGFSWANKDKCRSRCWYDFYSNWLILFELNSSSHRMYIFVNENRAHHQIVVLSLPIRFPFYFSLSLVCRVRTRNWKRDFHISLVGCAATSFIHRFSLVSLPFISNTYSMTGCMSSIYSISACVTRTKFICESVSFEHTKFIFIIYQIFFFFSGAPSLSSFSSHRIEWGIETRNTYTLHSARVCGNGWSWQHTALTTRWK